MATESTSADPSAAGNPDAHDVNLAFDSPPVESEGNPNESKTASTGDETPFASPDPHNTTGGSQAQHVDKSPDEGHVGKSHLLDEVNTTQHPSIDAQDDNIADESRQQESEIGSAELISEIRMLREKVSKIEEQAKQRPGYLALQAEWEAVAQDLGYFDEAEMWKEFMEHRPKISGEVTKADVDLPYTLDLDHLVREMNEDPLYESDVLRWRKSWETRFPPSKSLSRGAGRMRRQDEVYRNRRRDARHHEIIDSESPTRQLEDIDSDGSLDFEYNLDVLRHRYLQKVDRLHEERDFRLQKKIVERRRKLREITFLTQELRKEKEQQAQVKNDNTVQEDQASKPPSNADQTDGEGASKELASPSHAFPELNRVDWIGFRSLRKVPEEKSFAIDVLVGEPEISLGFPHRRGRARVAKQKSGNKGISQEGGSNAKQPIAWTGQSPLPERIRLHSQQLIRILDKIHGEKPRSHGSLVIIRPFKCLMYYNRRLRDWCQKLEKRFEAPETSRGASTETATTELEHREDPKDQRPSNRKQTPEDDTEGSKNDYLDNDADDDSDVDSDEDSDADSDDDSDNGSTSLTALQHLRCLLEFIDIEIANRLEHLTNPLNRRVFFSDMWHLFNPGDIVIAGDGKQAYRVISVVSPAHRVVPYHFDYWSAPAVEKNENTSFVLHCVYVDFDGKVLGPVRKQFTIKRFDNEKSVTSLEVYPLRFHARGRGEVTADGDNERFRQKLIDRGRKFAEIAAAPHRHMYYAGPALETREDIESQVVVDFELALSVEESKSKNWRPNIELVSAESKESEEKQECEAQCCIGENIHDDSFVDEKRNEEYVESLFPTSREQLPSVAVYPWPLQAIRSSEHTFSDDDMLIMSYRVFAFVLRTRKWEQLDLTHLSDVEGAGSELEGKTAFHRLVLPPDHKEMVQSLIAQHFRDKESSQSKVDQFDIVRGKGKGLILLLHGAPGVGKTSTAEGVAELFRKPLFQITCGDLGTTATDVEKALETNFALANRWGSILLLDEADVFLSARNPKDFKRNGLVAVFLRVLEYYAGILFLTTNRIGDFDEAFASRIHISLYYPPLDKSSTEQVFRLNLEMIEERMKKKGRKIKISHDEIIKYAGWYWTKRVNARWNGRQIRNASQTALALAEFEAVKKTSTTVRLSEKHIKRVAKSYLQFTKYLIELYGTDDSQRAMEGGLRASERTRGFNGQEGRPNYLKDLSSKFASTGSQRATQESTHRAGDYRGTLQHSSHLGTESRAQKQSQHSPVGSGSSDDISFENEFEQESSEEDSEEETEEESEDDHTSQQPLYVPDASTMRDSPGDHTERTKSQRQTYGGSHSQSRSKSRNKLSAEQGPSATAHESFYDPNLEPTKKSRGGKNRKGRQ